MGATSNIEWTQATWTPIRARNLATDKLGWHCEHASEACRFCYAERDNKRFGTKLDFKPGHRSDIEIFLDDNMLLAPLRWKKPRMIFVCSMTDAFADFVKDEWLDRMFAIMALCPQHTFQVLTKRPERMRDWVTQERKRTAPVECIAELYVGDPAIAKKWPFDEARAIGVGERGWPLPNVWLGVSAEDQDNYDQRERHLRATPAAVRFLSLEPLLGPIFGEFGWKKFDWVIVGGESGPHARPMHPDWARSLRDQCKAAGVPFFYKQTGEWAPFDGHPIEQDAALRRGGFHTATFPDGTRVGRVGKHAAGRLLDGEEHNGMPSLDRPNKQTEPEAA